MWQLDARLDPVAGGVVDGELRRVEQELFAADWAEARARVGEQPPAADLGRTPGQRRADALVEMAHRSAAMPTRALRPQPLVTVLVGSCDVQATRGEVDHVVPFEQGGPTTQGNGRCLCRFHHHQRHRGGATSGDPDPPRGHARRR